MRIGFFDGHKEYGQENPSDDHEKIAGRIINKKGLKRPANVTEPDFLVSEGFLKVGNSFGKKVVTFDPKKADNRVFKKVNEYRREGYEVDEVDTNPKKSRWFGR